MVVPGHNVLMIFVDGLGLGSDDPDRNPLADRALGSLRDVLTTARPIDACLGVEGRPQSATGQTTLLTGLNAARSMGRHVEGFPGRALKRVIRARNVFLELGARGCSSTFANAYYFDNTERVRHLPVHSVTTVAALAAHGELRCRDRLERNEAVYQDLTRASLGARGYQGPCIAPEEAAAHLVEIASGYRLTLFEYFQTDRAGHSGEREWAANVLGDLNRFLSRLLDLCPSRHLTLMLTSDHGNIEDLSTPTHTRNPVPFFAYGEGAGALRSGVQSLVDVTPALLRTIARDAPRGAD